MPGCACADEPVVGATRARSVARISHSADRTQSGTGGAVCAPQSAGLPYVRVRPDRRNKISARAVRRPEERHATRFARLQAGDAVLARRAYAVSYTHLRAHE